MIPFFSLFSRQISGIICWQRLSNQRSSKTCKNAPRCHTLPILPLLRSIGRGQTAQRLLWQNCYTRTTTREVAAGETPTENFEFAVNVDLVFFKKWKIKTMENLIFIKSHKRFQSLLIINKTKQKNLYENQCICLFLC